MNYYVNTVLNVLKHIQPAQEYLGFRIFKFINLQFMKFLK